MSKALASCVIMAALVAAGCGSPRRRSFSTTSMATIVRSHYRHCWFYARAEPSGQYDVMLNPVAVRSTHRSIRRETGGMP